MPSSIAEAFHRLAGEGPDRPAVHVPASGRTLTRQQVAADARTLREALARCGLHSRRCIVAALGNRPALLAFLLAALEADAAVVLLDGEAGLAHALATGSRFGADAVVVRADAVADGVTPHRKLPLGLALVPTALAADHWRRPASDGPVLLKMTSGSTGLARAVVAHESHLGYDAAQIAEAMDIGPANVNFAAVPLSHAYGLSNLVMPLLLQGAALVLRDRFSPRELAADVERYGVTTFPGVPYKYQYFAATAWPGQSPAFAC